MVFNKPPNVERLAANQNIRGLIKALTYEKDPRIGDQAYRALVKLGLSAREENDLRFFEVCDKFRNKAGKELRIKLERLSNRIFPEFAGGPRSRLEDRLLHPEDYEDTNVEDIKTKPLIIPKWDD